MALRIAARVGPSRIHGLGLIAAEAIPAGALIWEFEAGFDLAIPEAEFVRLSLSARRAIAYYACFDLERRCFVLSSDDDRFTNHSEDPNCDFVGGFQRARRPIQPGEELTIDYRALGWTQYLGRPAPEAPPPPMGVDFL